MKKYIKSDYTPKWTDYLDSDVRQRLGNCNSRKSDIVPLTQAKWAVLKNKPGNWTKEDALVQVLELLDSNSRYFDLTREEYDDILDEVL